jgi:hypothetical protein
VHEPVELVEMTLAFQGLGYEYLSYIKTLSQENQIKNTNDVKLYITKIESNCILAEMAPALPLLGSLAPILSDVNTVVDFIKNVGETIQWLISLRSKEPLTASDVPYTKKHISNVKDIVSMVGKANNANLGLKAIKYSEESHQDKISLEISFSSKDCQEAEKGAILAIQALEVREKADKENVLMYFYQTNTDDPKSFGRTGDKAIIGSITQEPLNVYILAEIDKQRVRHVLDDKSHNPLLTGFIVDVNIEKDRKGRPRVYRVVAVHDVIYGDDSN